MCVGLLEFLVKEKSAVKPTEKNGIKANTIITDRNRPTTCLLHQNVIIKEFRCRLLGARAFTLCRNNKHFVYIKVCFYFGFVWLSYMHLCDEKKEENEIQTKVQSTTA